METEACLGKVFEPTHVLADGDASVEQDRMCRTCTICYVVDVIGIDSHERGVGIRQELCCLACEERMTLEVLLGTPVPCPSGMD